MVETENLSVEAVQEKINEIGMGWFQVLALIMTGGIMFAEGSEMLIMGSITTLLHDHWDLSPFIKGLMVSVVFIGFSMGNMCSGIIGDQFGRRISILVAYVLIFAFGFATATAHSVAVMISLRFMVGVGCGIGFPSVYSLIPEMTPTKYRGVLSTLMIGFMPLGELFAALGVLMIDPHLERMRQCGADFQPAVVSAVGALSSGQEFHWGCSWRALCEFGASPALVFFLVSLFCLYESPVFLAVNGRTDEVTAVLKAMARMNGADVEIPEYTVGASRAPRQAMGSFGAALGELVCSNKYRSTTVFLWVCHFTKDFSVFGLAYVFPQYFKSLKAMAPALELIICALLAIPGVLLALLLSRSHYGQIPSIQLCSALAACGAVGMMDFAADTVGGVFAYLAKFMVLAFFIVVVIYTAEVFPSTCRNTAVGLCTAVGRLGSITAPLYFELSYAHTGSFDVFLGVILACNFLIAAGSRWCLTIETKGKLLTNGKDTTSYGTLDR